MHKIVYLGHNYLNNMAKACNSPMKDKKETEFWESLFDSLKEEVLADNISCPIITGQSFIVSGRYKG